jgi:hypothetical protein
MLSISSCYFSLNFLNNSITVHLVHGHGKKCGGGGRGGTVPRVYPLLHFDIDVDENYCAGVWRLVAPLVKLFQTFPALHCTVILLAE